MFSLLKSTSQDPAKPSDAGFTLIELLVAIGIMAIVLGLAVISIPNHDERHWRDDLDKLVATLNIAQEESAMSGMPMMVEIDSTGWRFSLPTANGSRNTPSGAAINNNPSSMSQTSGLMPDVYRSQTWSKPVEMTSLQLTLGREQVTQVLQIPIKQENRQAVLIRNTRGRFSWSNS